MASPLSIGVSDLQGMAMPLILDVREDWERDIAAIEGTVNIPLQALPTRSEELPKDRQIVVMCHHGGRSARATAWLRENGYDATNLEGGIDAWATQVDPAIARY
jgi:rhodanese-related sulfurtransferase